LRFLYIYIFNISHFHVNLKALGNSLELVLSQIYIWCLTREISAFSKVMGFAGENFNRNKAEKACY